MMDKCKQIHAALIAAGYTDKQIVLVYPTSPDWKSYQYGIRVRENEVTLEEMDDMNAIAQKLLPPGQKASVVWA